MFKKIKSVLSGSKSEPVFEVEYHPYGVSFKSELMEECRSGKASQIMQLQFISLRMMVEQEQSVELANGFDITSDDVVRLSQTDRMLLGLPKPWPGEFKIDFHSTTTLPDFNIKLKLVLPSGETIRHFSLKGPLLKLSDKEEFLPDPAQWLLLNTVTEHNTLTPDDKTERVNLLAVKSLQNAASKGAAIDLSHFDGLIVDTPDGITVSASQNADGSLSLLPAFHNKTENQKAEDSSSDSTEIAAPDFIDKRLAQFENGKGIMRVADTLVVLKEEQIGAVEEILSNRTIPAEQVQMFLDAPGAFLDAAKIDFDLGFSIRVKGVTEFQPAYFGETDSSTTDWTDIHDLSLPSSIQLSDLPGIVKTDSELDTLRQLIKKARGEGKNFVDTEVEGKPTRIVLGDEAEDNKILEEAREKIKAKEKNTSPKPEDEPDEENNKKRSTVDIIPEDEEHELENKLSPNREYCYAAPLALQDCNRTPFSYQEKGIRWLLGIATNNGKMDWKTNFIGGLLADDMGLGKTFMSLTAAIEYAKIQQEQGSTPKPCLVVAPLSLLQNWKEELEAAYDPQPFSDVVILQSKEDLPKFKARKGNEVRQKDEDIASGLDALRYTLKVGASWGPDRLDMPNRLVLSTYQVLRDYQFSLCRVDWGFVIFDEAQNIKNPNALQTRAAKGLKADMVVPATGTPVENGLTDFWCLFDTACPGILKNYQDFREKYVAPIRKATNETADEVRSEIGASLRQNVGSLMLRRTKEEELEGIPKKHIHYYQADMCDRQRELYEAVLGSANIRNEDEPRGPVILKALHSLRDVSLHPALMSSGQPLPPSDKNGAEKHFKQSAKLETLLDILDAVKERGEKIIIFALRRRLQAYLSMGLGTIYGLQVEIINGQTKTTSKNSDTTRMGIIKRFEAKEGFNILIMSPIAAGVGLTVIGANNVVHLERHWNPAKEAQATDRVYRIGQQKDVHVHIPMLTHPKIDSFDLHLDRLLSKKLDLKDAVITPVGAGPEDFMTSGVFGGKLPSSPAPRINGTQVDEDMSWESFEALSALIMAKEYSGETMLTSHPNDYGADSVVVSEREVILIQSKHYPDKLFDSGKAIREVYGARPKYEKLLSKKINKMIVMTSAKRISSTVKNEAKEYGVEIINGKDLNKLLDKHELSYNEIYALLDSDRFPK